MANFQLSKRLQQPEWNDSQVQSVGAMLSSRPPLVRESDVQILRSLLSEVAADRSLVIQAGDCAEDIEDCTPAHVSRKSAVLDVLAGALRMASDKPVLRAGRIGGQFGKPRSSSTEKVGDLTLPVFRGQMVNRPEPTVECRTPDPVRILTGYMAASDIMEHLGWRGACRRSEITPPVWTSHEALILDYEIPMLRPDELGTQLLTSTHWPWIGERTRQIAGPHVDLLAGISNPVACKVGPDMSGDELIAMCARLDPEREPGRLTLIARMGADLAADRLPALVESVRSVGHPVIWLCDPMHANTIVTPDGRKTRMVETLMREVRNFVTAVRSAGGVAGGLHLETTPDDVTECASDEAGFEELGDRYTSLCDPRLTLKQAVAVVSAWAD
jgi:3-deoxy-7-phosphoheptulonate synthase